MNGKDWVFAENYVDHSQIFNANNDRSTKVMNRFRVPFVARAIKICPVSFNNEIALRCDAYFIENDELAQQAAKKNI